MPALAYYDRTVIAGELAFATGAFEIHAADTAGIVGLFGEIPFPGGDGFEEVDSDFHCGDWRGCGDEVYVRDVSCVIVVVILLVKTDHSRCLYLALTDAARPSTARSKSGVASRLLGSD
jgi:hypothetical protein